VAINRFFADTFLEMVKYKNAGIIIETETITSGLIK
jgi:hypothetical protein